jgi:glycosyltransferase involved in cell wall biosynthesis
MAMKVFMLGWEFPPFISGGLGTACYGLTKAMNKLDTEITFVLPGPADKEHSTHVKMLTPDSLSQCTEGSRCCIEESIPELLALDSILRPYQIPGSCKCQICQSHTTQSTDEHQPVLLGADLPQEHYGGDIQSQVRSYAAMASMLARTESYDVIHAHDWMTYYAGVTVAKLTEKPLVIHVHSTEFDRSGENINQQIYDVERYGMYHADRILAVSNYTRNVIIERYGVPEQKVHVVHNGMDMDFSTKSIGHGFKIRKKDKVVLFMGRITMQKGPEYFIHAARMVADHIDDVKFIMAGSGDMQESMIELAAEIGMGPKMLFTGFLRGDDVKKAYQMADLFVMPSVSEPFGLVPLEALINDVPVIISKQSGVSEVLTNALKVDFWDVNELANKIISVLRYPALSVTLQGNGRCEAASINWDDPARKCIDAYNDVIGANS